MMSRIIALTGYLLRNIVLSVAGVLYILSIIPMLIWFFPFGQRTPELSYFITLIAIYGAILIFLVTLTIAGRANQAASYALIVRLPSRVEYLVAVLLAAIVFATAIQTGLAVIVLLQPAGPEASFGRLLEIPPLWLSINIFMAVLALHATDFVMSNWSRVIVFGLLTILLFTQSVNARTLSWFSTRLSIMAQFFARQGMLGLTQFFNNASGWVTDSGGGFFSQVIGFIFWPFRAMSDAVKTGSFDSAQALAPAIVLLYATILFMIASDLFANKDLHFVE
ncbi:MAG: hypothetical protein M9941_06045 [Anaerolineae bacterium]|nr:hypothetical protein [Anaerolineae bacterium]MCO5197299.1 hypothetical protein [Anaerolineae bacterium]